MIHRSSPSFSVLILLAFLSLLIQACNDEVYVTDPRENLRFSSDTVSFDTIFSEVGSTTAWLTIRNTGNRPIRVARIFLQSEGQTGFRINLDGESAVSFSDVEIPGKDSLFLFVEVTAPSTGNLTPQKIHDAILFETDGPQKRIVLEAWGWDAKIWRGKVISADTVLNADIPYLIYDSLVVAPGVTLTLAPGTRLHFHDQAFMKVAGTLKARGTVSDPIQMRGDRLDLVLPDLPYDFYPGQWYYLRFTGESYGNELDHLDLHGAYYGIINDSSALDRTKLTLTNSTVHNMVNTCLYSIHSRVVVRNTQISNSGSFTVALLGGASSFIHCTIVNYEPTFMVNRDAPTLGVFNYVLDASKKPVGYPLQAEFHNTLVFGSQSAEVYLADTTLYAWDLIFDRCMLRSPVLPAEAGTIVNCIYPSQPKFLQLGLEEDRYRFDFRPDSLSPAIDYGSAGYLDVCPLDRNGVPRDSKPDIGAYEWYPGQK